ncbi:septum formation initiator family protein [bacterium]|nr:septum formation initiator family protein [bacterium]
MTTPDDNLNNPEMQESIRYSPVAEEQKVAKVKKKKMRKDKVKKGFYYSFLTIVLLFCLIQVGFGAILNISKTISYKAKIKTLEKVRDDAEMKNRALKEDIKEFSTTTSLEEIARNNLKMAGEDEVLVIINKSEPKEEETQNKKY